ncbi:mersacidin family lantibiotic [Actinomyces qiguomingii]|uniref:lichenicidin A2 family type 2 lantibiotic n=1 Tax=Actinomyces qiguomingii TaxID=2057800 RepID=UPI000CA0073E
MNTEKVGASFDALSQTEMDFVIGAAGNVQPAATPSVTTSSLPCLKISASSVTCGGASVSGLFGLVSYMKRCI